MIGIWISHSWSRAPLHLLFKHVCDMTYMSSLLIFFFNPLIPLVNRYAPLR